MGALKDAGEVLALVDRLGDPKRMTRVQFIELLDEVVDGCNDRKEAASEAEFGGVSPAADEEG